jgi:heme-degrading monooxygenase HmoA
LYLTNDSVTISSMLRRALWTPGPAESAEGPFVISLTDYTTHRWRDVPGVALSGLRLSRAWPTMPGAVGLWLWSDLPRRRSGSISIWTSEDDLRRFVRWPVHLAIVRKYRSRGRLTASSWEAERFVKPDVLREARRRLLG